MKRMIYESAIAEFFQGGGEVRRIETPVRVSEPELFEYLAKCGLPVKVFVGDPKPYGCNGKRFTMGPSSAWPTNSGACSSFPR